MSCRLRILAGLACLCLCLTLTSCAKKKPPEISNKVQLTKVIGKLLVDGQPMGGVMIRYKAETEVAEKRAAYSAFYTVSNRDGTFALKTYVQNDGVPPGEYSLYCESVPATRAEIAKEGEADRFGGQYSAPNPPVKKVTVGSEPIDLGTIELKTVPKNQRQQP